MSIRSSLVDLCHEVLNIYIYAHTSVYIYMLPPLDLCFLVVLMSLCVCVCETDELQDMTQMHIFSCFCLMFPGRVVHTDL